MSETVNLIMDSSIPLIAGLILGLFFYSGLWWTTHKVIDDSWSPIWFIGSFVLRMSVVGSGFYLIAAPKLSALLLCFLGFMLARLLFTRILQRIPENRLITQPGDSHHAP